MTTPTLFPSPPDQDQRDRQALQSYFDKIAVDDTRRQHDEHLARVAKTLMTGASDSALSAGTGLLRGIAAVAGAPQDLLNVADGMIGSSLGFLGDRIVGPRSEDQMATAVARRASRFRGLPSSYDIRDAGTALTGITLHEPTTRAGRFAETIGEFVPGAIAVPGSIAGNIVKYGFLPGAASEAVGQATEGTKAESLARLAAALGAGGAAAIASRPSTITSAIKNAPELLAVREPEMYNPPVKKIRPFEADYPAGARADESGKLLEDIEGRTLGADIIVGRRMVGGEDQGIGPPQYDTVSTVTTGGPAVLRTSDALDGALGGVRLGPGGRPETPALADDLAPSAAPLVYGHEIGHVIHRLVEQGKLEVTDALEPRLRYVYNTLNNPKAEFREREAWNGPTKPLPEGIVSPETRGYPPAMVDYELWAEAIRAYMTDPNYLKSVAPEVAAAIRAAVNTNPSLMSTIQFNGIAGGGLGVGLGAYGLSAASGEREPGT